MFVRPDFISRLQQLLAQPLPGETAQYRMAPSYRPKLSKEQIAALNPKISGVLLLLYEKENQYYVVLTERKKYDGVHSGQMSFPGGKKEVGDLDLTATALRETQEEIGVKQEHIALLGHLSELYIPPSNFLVFPSVGFGQNMPKFVPEKKEVETIVEVPLAHLLNSENINLEQEIRLPGMTVRAPAYIYNQHVIWGATAIMLSEFTFLCEKLNE
jgi:8-oxo-dGTP pyrophosphatase MutT (NUDIX family)